MSAALSFLAELKRRNVLRAGLPYAGAMWVLAEGVDQVGCFPHMGSRVTCRRRQ